MAKKFTVSALTGGAFGALDAIDGNILSDGDWATATIPGVGVSYYELVADSGAAESSPDIIAPDDNPGTKRWILRPAEVYQALFNTQNLGTISSAKTINATDYSTITGDFTASFTATFEGFTASRKSVLLHLVVSGGGAPTITIAGYTFKFMTTANLTSMADGTYQVVVNNPKTDTNAFVYVKLAP